MGQKVNPIGLRLGITRTWDSLWFEKDKKKYVKNLHEDLRIRDLIDSELRNYDVGHIEIYRYPDKISIIINTAQPGKVIGRKGQDIERLKEKIKAVMDPENKDKQLKVSVSQIKQPNLCAKIVATRIARQIENRISHRYAIKNAIKAVMAAGAKGVKVRVSGRLMGAEMARREKYIKGRVPLQTLRADIDYWLAEAITTYGKVGVKVWIFKGEVVSKNAHVAHVLKTEKVYKESVPF